MGRLFRKELTCHSSAAQGEFCELLLIEAKTEKEGFTEDSLKPVVKT